MNALLKFITLAAIAAAGVTAAQAQRVAGPNRPAAVPQGYLITPFGYFHPSCVLHAANGDEVLQEQHVIRHPNGSTTNIPVCAYPHYRADGEKVQGDERAIQNPDISHAWVEAMYDIAPAGSYGYLYAEWSVPPTPSSNDDQTLYYFPGVEDLQDVVTIVQPVLGWNSDFAGEWGVASWNCCASGTTVEGTPQHASPGDNILGYMWDLCVTKPQSCKEWDIVTWDVQNGNYSELLDTPSQSQIFNWAFGGVLEVYNIKQCSDYPSRPGYWGGSEISFNTLGLFQGEVQVTPRWTVWDLWSGLTPQCSYGGSTSQQVILYY